MLLAVFLAGYFGLIPYLRTLIIMSGSMEPALRIGSIVVVTKAGDYNPGDIITFTPSDDPKSYVTHRIKTKKYSEGTGKSPVFTTAGDANKNADSQEVKPAMIKGKVVFSLPYIGFLADFIKKPYGFILFVIVPATIIVYEELKSIKMNMVELYRERKKKKKADSSYSTYTGFRKLTIVIPVVAIAFSCVTFTFSYFSDKESSSNNSFIAGVWITASPIPTITLTPTVTPTPTTTVTPTVTPTPTNIPTNTPTPTVIPAACISYCTDNEWVAKGCANSPASCIDIGGDKDKNDRMHGCEPPTNFCCCK